MEPDKFLELQLSNFQKWSEKTIRLYPGVTLMFGKSGKGKSTFCRAIHFCLFGGKKWRKLITKGSKNKRTFVRFTNVSPNNTYTIIRERPSESISVELYINGIITNLVAASAQAWICSVFGTEDSWNCSSYLIQDERHFFLRETNANKKELLKQITFGDTEGSINPDHYLNILSCSCVNLKTKIEGIAGELKTRTFLADDIILKNSDIYMYGDFTPELLQIAEQELYSLLNFKTELEIKLHDNNSRINLEKELVYLIKQEEGFNIDEMENKMIKYKNIMQIMNIKSKLLSFDIDVLKINIDELKNDHYLYQLYVKSGYISNENITHFLSRKKEEYDNYQKYLMLIKENEIIDKENVEIYKSNTILIDNHKLKVERYNNRIEEIKQYKKQLDNYEQLKELHIEYIEYLRISNINKEIDNDNNLVNENNKKLLNVYHDKKLRYEQNIKDIELFKRRSDEFIIKKEQYEKYKRYLRLTKENEIIERENITICENNKALQRSYEIRISQYKQKLKDIELYKKKEEAILLRKKTIEDTKFILFDEKDDGTSDFVRSVISYCELANKELTCPHCLKGVIYENSRLQKGCLASEEMRLINNQKLELALLELKRRQDRERFLQDEKEFNLIPIPTISEEVEEPKLMKIKELIPCVKVDNISFNLLEEQEFINRGPPLKLESIEEPILTSFKDKLTCKYVNYVNFNEIEYKQFLSNGQPSTPEPVDKPILQKEKQLNSLTFLLKPTLEIFEIPKLDYNKVYFLISSLDLIPLYKEWSQSEYKDEIIDNFTVSILNQNIITHKNNQNRIKFETERLSKLQPLDNEIQNKIYNVMRTIDQLKRKVEIGKLSLALISHREAIQYLSNQHFEMVSYIDKFTALSKFITSVANSSIDDIIASINNSLEIICNDLFESPISIILTTTKLLKNGNEQNNVDIEILYGGEQYDVDELSGGELKRVYLALMLGFSRINLSPIVIIDEALPNMEADLKDISINKIKEWTLGKYVIHICHDLGEGQHDHIINI